jgi:hypothetical protein
MPSKCSRMKVLIFILNFPCRSTASWSISASEYWPDPGGDRRVAHFECQCSSVGEGYRGSLSQIMADPLSTIPLHLINTNLTISVEISNCQKIRLALDFAELIFLRSTASASIDFVLKVRLRSLF